MDDLFDMLDEYDPNWSSNFNTLREAAVHFGLEEMLADDADEEETYAPLDFN